MATCTAFLVFFCLCGVASGVSEDRNATALLLETGFGGPVARAQAPPSIMFMDTPIAVRYVFMYAMIYWNTFSACDSKALNFWGERDPLPEEVCQGEATPGELFAYSYLRAAEQEFPEPAAAYAVVMSDNGYDPEDRSMDKSTAVGMANYIGTQIAQWLGEDGMNSKGDWSISRVGMQYEDYTGYSPVNSPWELKHPLRWQPLKEADSRPGRFTFQAHVVPQMGRVRTMLLTMEETNSRYVTPPFNDMSGTELSPEDAALLEKMALQVMDIYANLTAEERMSARWWDSKFGSAGVFEPYYHSVLEFDPGFRARWQLGDMLAQRDSLILAWKEKVRIDAVRPKSVIQNLYRTRHFKTYAGASSVGHIVGEAWEPPVMTQPHSEFPSASAALCTAFADFGTLMLQEHMAKHNMSREPPFIFSTKSFIIPIETEGLQEISFETMQDAARECGQSRLWAGVHFQPSILAGEALAEGLGMKAYNVAKALSEGRIPDNCWWCKSRR